MCPHLPGRGSSASLTRLVAGPLPSGLLLLLWIVKHVVCCAADLRGLGIQTLRMQCHWVKPRRTSIKATGRYQRHCDAIAVLSGHTRFKETC